MHQQNSRLAHAAAVRAIQKASAAKRVRRTIRTLLGAALLGAGLGLASTPSFEDPELTLRWVQASTVSSLAPSTRTDPPILITIHGRTYRTGTKELAGNRYVRRRAAALAYRTGAGAVLGLLLAAALTLLASGARRKRQAILLAERLVSGTCLVPEAELAKRTAIGARDRPLHLGLVPIPIDLETRHFAMAGTTGSGKTTALRQMLDAIEARGDAALVYDTSGEFIQHYYNPARGDVILNPFDQRGAFWNPFDEINHPADADRIAHYLITETGARESDVWLDTSRILVANIIRILWSEGRGTPAALLDALQTMSRPDLEEMLASTSSARTFAKDADRATGSVLFMLTKAADLLMFLRAEPRDGERGFSFARFFRDLDQWQGRQRWIFVPRKEDYFEAMKPLMALWLECAASGMLGLSPAPGRRVWFLLDEIADLPRVDNLTRLLPEGRKFGAAVTLTFQSIGQIYNRYGRERGEALLGCCNTKLFLQLVDQESREWASRTIGNVEVEIPTITDSLDPRSGQVTSSLSKQRQVRPAVLESELRLPRHTGYLVFPDNLPIARIQLTDAHIRSRMSMDRPRFVPGEISETLWARQAEPRTRSVETPPSGPGPV